MGGACGGGASEGATESKGATECGGETCNPGTYCEDARCSRCTGCASKVNCSDGEACVKVDDLGTGTGTCKATAPAPTQAPTSTQSQRENARKCLRSTRLVSVEDCPRRRTNAPSVRTHLSRNASPPRTRKPIPVAGAARRDESIDPIAAQGGHGLSPRRRRQPASGAQGERLRRLESRYSDVWAEGA